jgi:xylulokinase
VGACDRGILVLAIDMGTGGVRAALLDLGGRTVAFRAREHDQIVSSFGRAEQRPADWWAGAVGSIRASWMRSGHSGWWRSRLAARCTGLC